MFGDFDTPGSQYLAIQFVSCDMLDTATCRTVPEVTEWLKHKYILLYYTEDKPSEEAPITEQAFSKFIHQPINRQTNMSHRFFLHEITYGEEKFYSVNR